jgi:hypothetical protein
MRLCTDLGEVSWDMRENIAQQQYLYDGGVKWVVLESIWDVWELTILVDWDLNVCYFAEGNECVVQEFAIGF